MTSKIAIGLMLSAGLLSLGACAPDSDGRSFERAEAAMAKGDYASARVELLNAARERPTDAAVQLATATTLLELGDAVGGDAAAREARRLGADAAAVAILIGDAAIMRGDAAAAATAAQRLPASHAANRARILGGAAMISDDPAMAIMRFREGLTVASDDARLHIDLGHALIASGDIEGAQAAALRARALDARRVGAHLLIARIAEQRQDMRAALAAYDAALALQSRNVVALVGRAAMLGELGRADEIAALVPRLEEVAPGDPRTAYIKAVAAAAAGDSAGAHALLGGAGAALDDHLGATTLAAQVALDLGYISIGVSKARRAYAMASGEPYLNFLLADALWRDGQMAEARTVMRFFDDVDTIPPVVARLQAALAAGTPAPPPTR